MKRIVLLAGILFVFQSLISAQSNYRLESDGTYTYTGLPVSQLDVDFTTWWGSYLPTTLTDDMPLAEKNELGFVKWKITQRDCGSKGKVYALFNNNNNDFSGGPTNVNTTNKPRIYLPTTANSVNSITIFGGIGDNLSLYIYYKDNEHLTWTYKDAIRLQEQYEEITVNLNTVGPTSIYIEYRQTSWVSITNLSLDIQPSYTFNSTTGHYDYIGEPVEEFKVDFTKWTTTDLPSTLADDMSFVENRGLGFIKWKINERTCGDKGNVKALFNNNNNDFSGGPTNANTTNKPRIYLPTTTGDITAIKLFGGNGNVPVSVYYKDDNHTEWTNAGYISLTTTYAEHTFKLKTKGKTSIYLEYASGSWIAITDIELIRREVLYEFNTSTSLYDYIGEPVDKISVNFSTWDANDLPTTLTDDMVLTEAEGLGFIKWKLVWYNQGGLNQRVLFNNNNSDFSGGPANGATSNKPTIYFPTTASGVKNIKITYLSGQDIQMTCHYKDDVSSGALFISMPTSTDDAPKTAILELDSKGKTSMRLVYGATVWTRILSIEVELKENENTQLGLWDYVSSATNETKLNAVNGVLCDVYFKRSFVADGAFYTLCLPFDLTQEQVQNAFGNCTIAKLISSDYPSSDLIRLQFDYVNHIEAGLPYLFLPEADIESIYFTDVVINTNASKIINTTYFGMTGIYNPTSLSNEDYILGPDNYLSPVTNSNPLRPFRAFFTIQAPTPKNTPAKVVFGRNQTTDIEQTTTDIPTQKIINEGKVYIQIGDTIYNLNGQIVK